MKKRVGMLYGKPIIVGDKNDQTVNEIYLSSKEPSGNNGFNIPIIEIAGAENNKMLVTTDIGTFKGDMFQDGGEVSVSIHSSELFNYFKNKYNINLKIPVTFDTVTNKVETLVVSINHGYSRFNIGLTDDTIIYLFSTEEGNINISIINDI